MLSGPRSGRALPSAAHVVEASEAAAAVTALRRASHGQCRNAAQMLTPTPYFQRLQSLAAHLLRALSSAVVGDAFRLGAIAEALRGELGGEERAAHASFWAECRDASKGFFAKLATVAEAINSANQG